MHETRTYRAVRGRMLQANTAKEHGVILERKATNLKSGQLAFRGLIRTPCTD